MCLYSGYTFYLFIGSNFAYQLTAKYNTKHQPWGDNNIAGPDWFSVGMCIFNTEAIRYASQYTADTLKIHMKQPPIRYDMILLLSAIQCDTLRFDLTQCDTMQCDMM